MAETQAKHRQQVEMLQAQQAINEGLRGQMLGAIVAAGAFAASTLMVIYGSATYASVAASILGGGTLVAIVTVFVTGRRAAIPQNEERGKHRPEA